MNIKAAMAASGVLLIVAAVIAVFWGLAYLISWLPKEWGIGLVLFLFGAFVWIMVYNDEARWP